MLPSIEAVRPLLERIGYAATGPERWIASLVIGALGLLALTAHGRYWSHTSPGAGAVLLSGLPILLAALVVAAAIWLPRSEYGRSLPRIALWCVGAAAVFVAVGQLVVLALRPLGDAVGMPLFVLGYMETAGTAVGLIVGIYDADSARTKRELERQRERAERYAQQLTVLNRILRHDVRTGVQIIRGYADMLPEPEDLEPSVPLDRIRERAQAMYETAESTREIEAIIGEGERMVEPLDVATALESAVDVVGDAHPAAAIEVVPPADGSPTVVASRILDLALTELLTNAVEHNHRATPTVRVDWAVDGDAVEVRVRDDGPGIPDRELEPLRRGGETALVHTSGVGLWLANWIVGISDGTLTFGGNADGGSTVTVRLPRAGDR